MDRSVDGGMAPALQSCNHQSTGLVNKKVEGNQEEDVLPHEKVNGSAFPHDSIHDNPVGSSVTSSRFASASGDTDSCNPGLIESVQSPAHTEACTVSGLKETLPEVSMPAIHHIGQGDSTVQNVMNYNGWNDCKRSHAGGILQESSNISGMQIAGKGSNKKTTLTKADSLKTTADLSEGENKPNGKFRIVPHNGDLLQRSPSSVQHSEINVATIASTVANTITFSTASCSHFITTSSPQITDCQITQPSTANSDPVCALDLSDHDTRETVSQSFSSLSPTMESRQIFGVNSLKSRTLDYSDLLSSDLSKINMSDKLANTLQEVAASLKGSGISLSAETNGQRVASSELNNTVNVEGQDSSGQSVKGLDFSITPGSRCEPDFSSTKREAILEEKRRKVEKSAGILHCRLHQLRKSIDALRSQSIADHVSQEILEVSSHIPASKTLDLRCPQATESEQGNFVIHSTDHSELWHKLFQNSTTQTYKKASEGDASSTRSLRLSKTLSESDKISVKKELCNESKPTGDMPFIDMVPYVQLTRVEDLKAEETKKQDVVSHAMDCSGVLLKELKYVQSRCDPDLTESSSDEEIVEPFVGRSVRTKSFPKTSLKSGIGTRFRKSFCKWSAERAEISRRWAWLQSRISSLEFDIRQQGDLYSQMRESKGVVQLEMNSKLPQELGQVPRGNSIFSRFAPISTSPRDVSMLVDNAHLETSRLLNNLSRVSGSSQSLSQAPVKSSQDLEDACARVKYLSSDSFRNRKLVKIPPSVLAPNKGLRSKTVPNDSRLMGTVEKRSEPDDSLSEGNSFILKAAMHDHSYHSVISSIQDIPLSISMRAVMKSRRKWCKKSSPHKQENKVSNKHKKRKKRHKAQKKNRRLFSNVQNYVEDGKRRKLSSQASDSSRKRLRDGSLDSDLDSPVVIGGFSSHPFTGSRATTPTNEITGQSQNYWKKKKTSEQAYDINNIVIPHGLNSTRIEKLAYKEIQTPSWKTVELSPISETEETSKQDGSQDNEEEDTSAAAFQRRHDNHEIIEKRKYMAFMEWSISRRGSRGSRMGNIRGPTPDPDSPTPLSYTPSPVSFVGEPFLNHASTTSMAPVSSSMTSATSPTAKPGVTTRRRSSDQNGAQPSTPPSHHQQHTQRIADTSLSYSFSSPSLASWQDGLGSRHGSSDAVTPVNRTLSDGSNGCKNDQANSRTWEMRSFPLSEEDIKLLEDVEYAKAVLKSISGSPDQHQGPEAEDGNKRNPFTRQPSGEKYSADHVRSSSQDGQIIKSTAAKRRRTDSRASSLASHDDTARHSDCSSASASSVQRKRKRPSFARSRSSLQRLDHGRGKGPLRRLDSSRSKHKYLNIRLSETDDSTSDSDSDSNSSDEETSESCNDAGNVIDDYADPEWEFPRRERR